MDAEFHQSLQEWCALFNAGPPPGPWRPRHAPAAHSPTLGGDDRSQLAAALYQRLATPIGFGHFAVWLETQGIEGPAVSEQQFAGVMAQCIGWPSFLLLDLYDTLDLEDAGQVPLALCHAVLCMWLAKEARRSAACWRAFQHHLLPVAHRYLGRTALFQPPPEAPTTGMDVDRLRATEWLRILAGWTASDFPKEFVDKVAADDVASLYAQLLEWWDRGGRLSASTPPVTVAAPRRRPSAAEPRAGERARGRAPEPLPPTSARKAERVLGPDGVGEGDDRVPSHAPGTCATCCVVQ
eukprot:TRINITY_DN1930_c0_g1_i1.p3 TRINITY_DN1930_c0_g1~~TRINITY_DN1930_c0_g1_i1.p3  ORF type:complete len:295 (+),score=55.82 TRINITY_DN1930_c0_g1_i1:93-977(+)